MATVKSIIETARNNRNENGVAYLAAKDVAVLVRAALKKAFPGVKFGVRSDYSGIDVSWVDGPVSSEVSGVIGQFSFGGFDGSIDMAYSSRNWLLPSGEMTPAESRGTCGSMGCVEGYATDCPEAGSVLVGSGVKYMGTHRDMSAEYFEKLRKRTVEHYGIKDNGESSWRVYHNGDA
jgi:hypothetical protein